MEVPVDEGKAFADANPLMAVFRQLLFARIVPNLDKLGLRTPKVREFYGSPNLLRFEPHQDSASEELAAAG